MLACVGKWRRGSAVGLLLATLAASVPAYAHDIAPGPPGEGVVVTDSGLVLPVRDIREDGFAVSTPCRNEGFVSSGAFLSGVDVVLDPGHGGRDWGAVGPGGVVEKDLNLKVASAAAADLRGRGYSVLLTRTTDLYMPVVVRAEIARAVDPAVFVSIHHNAGGASRRHAGPGTETYHQARNPSSVRLAGLLYEEIHQALSRYEINWRHSVHQGANAVLRTADREDFFGILRYTPGMTSVLTEAAYLDTRVQARLLADPEAQSAQAAAIANGIDRYLTSDDPGSGHNGAVRRVPPNTGHPACADPHLEDPPAATVVTAVPYTDVAENVHLPAIDELAGTGIIDGAACGPGLFCPQYPIQRWMVAVWLVRALDEEDPPPSAANRFGDVDSRRWWAPYVERMAALGITRGCDARPARFCPHSTVTRAQMASFLTRAFNLVGGPPSGFADTLHNPHSSDIDALSAAGIAGECATDPVRFCPSRPTSRDRAATLLVRALHYAGTLDDRTPQ